MRAFVITAPGHGEVQDVEPPLARPGQVVVDIERAGVCGTDSEFFSGEMVYLASGDATYPVRIGHEWCGRVVSLGADVDDDWLGRRVTGDTMLGCGSCARCLGGKQHLCAERYEIGIRRGWPGALAEQLAVPASALVALPEGVDEVAGALVEPGGNALRAVRGAALTPGAHVLVIGAGTIGLLAAQIARAQGARVDLLGRSARSREFAGSLGFERVFSSDAPQRDVAYDAVIDASNDSGAPALAAELVEPGGRVVYIGISGEPSLLDTRTLAIKDVTAVGVLSASGGLSGTVELYSSGSVDPRPLVATTVGLEEVAAVLAGERPSAAGQGPKLHVDPRR